MGFIEFWTFGILLLDLSAKNVFAKPTVTGSGVFTVGAQKTLSCQLNTAETVTGNPLTWSANGVTFSPTDARSSVVAGNVKSYTITYKFTVAISDHNKKYTCTARLPSGTTENSWTVYVEKNADTVDITGPTTVVGGQEASWQCVVDGSSTSMGSVVQWQYGNTTRIPSSQFTNKEIMYPDSSGLQIYKLTSNLTLFIPLGGPSFRLLCTATAFGTAPPSYDEVSITVTYPPQISSPTNPISVTSGVAQVLACTILANPPVTSVTWYKDGKLLDIPGSNGRLSGSIPSSPSLYINPSVREDAGSYACGANNSVGYTLGASRELTVRFTPLVTYTANPVSGPEGSDLPLTCMIEAVPAYTTVIWYRIDNATGNEIPISSATNPSKYSADQSSTNFTLVIKNLAVSDVGNYRCVVYNDVGRGQGVILQVKVNYKPIITVQSSVVVTEPNPTTLPCSVDASPAVTSLTWRRQGQVVDVSDKGHYAGGSVSQPTLTILRTSSADAGVYTCEATNPVGTTASEGSTLLVLYVPVITVPATAVNGTLGQRAILNVTIETYPGLTLLKWRKWDETTRTYVDVNEASPVYGGGTIGAPDLHILSLTKSDAGRYVLVTVNSIGQRQSAPIDVTVSYKPEISGQPSLTATEPNSVTIPCNVDAYPAITVVTWYKGGQVLNISDQARYSGGTVSQPSLTIAIVSGEDPGSYYCIASNSMGTTTSSSTDLVVSYFPVITVSRAEVAGDEGTTVTLDVTVRANPALTSLQWRKRNSITGNYVAIDITSDSYRGGVMGNPALEIVSLNTSDAGSYVLVATNSLGQKQSPPIAVAVSYAPSNPTFTGLESIYKENELINLTCSSDGFPTPEYKWYRGTDLVGSGPVYTIASAKVSDIGQYRCEATNSEGTASNTASINLLYKPRAGLFLSNVTSAVSQTVTLICSTLANPEPTQYNWTHNGVPITSADTTSRLLTVEITNSSMMGRYDCLATNSEGTSDPISVYILENSGTGGGPNTGQSTEATGLSLATLILIIIVCIIFLLILILLCIYCCTRGQCAKKDNNVSPTQAPPVTATSVHSKPGFKMNGYAVAAPPAKPVLAEPGRKPKAGADRPANGLVNGHTNGRISLEDEKASSPALRANGNAALGHGLSISVPGGATPRPHHLPPLGQDGHPEETESAREEKPKRKRRKRRDEPGAMSTSPKPDFDV